MPNLRPSDRDLLTYAATMTYLLACATDPGDRCGDPACPGYHVNGDTDTVERCDECASHHGYSGEVADEDVWNAVKACQIVGRAIPINVTPETLVPKRLLSVDQAYTPEAWWNAARRVTDAVFVEAFERLEERDAALVTAAQAKTFLALAATLPGWDGGPDHAPHPILVTDR